MVTGRMFVILLAGCSFQPGTAALDGGSLGDGPRADGGATADADGPDGDNDGIADSTDNCPAVANAGQADEDTDTVGDVCDNCPHLANANQTNADSDGVGDACDPQPGTANQLVLFLPFNDAAEIAGWSSAGTNATFVVTGGALEQQGATDLALLWKNDLAYTDVWATTRVTYLALQNEQFRGASLMTRFERSIDFGRGAGCGETRDTQFNSGNPFLGSVVFGGSGFAFASHGGPAQVTAGHSQVYRTRIASGSNLECSVGANTYSRVTSSQTGTGINFAVWGTTVKFDYLVVID